MIKMDNQQNRIGGQSDHESGYFEGDDVDDDLEIIHEEIRNPGGLAVVPVKNGLVDEEGKLTFLSLKNICTKILRKFATC